jgi:hypothetical protein
MISQRTTLTTMPLALDPILQDNICCIEQALTLIGKLTPALYSTESDAAPGTTIGGHIRHNIDHYKSFLAQATTGSIDYDERERETAAETDPGVAFQRLSAIGAALGNFTEDDLGRPVKVKMDSGSAVGWSQSTLRRELQFLLSHSVHHYAIIAIVCRSHGIEVPADFGVAPSTLKYRDGLAGETPSCAH